MLKVKDYAFIQCRYPSAVFIASDFGDGISLDDAEALDFALKPVYFEDDAGRHYFDLMPFNAA